jgi:hypothetical protein
VPDTLALEPTTEEADRLEAALAAVFAQVERIDERVARGQQESEDLRAETWRVPAQLEVAQAMSQKILEWARRFLKHSGKTENNSADIRREEGRYATSTSLAGIPRLRGS